MGQGAGLGARMGGGGHWVWWDLLGGSRPGPAPLWGAPRGAQGGPTATLNPPRGQRTPAPGGPSRSRSVYCFQQGRAVGQPHILGERTFLPPTEMPCRGKAQARQGGQPPALSPHPKARPPAWGGGSTLAKARPLPPPPGFWGSLGGTRGPPPGQPRPQVSLSTIFYKKTSKKANPGEIPPDGGGWVRHPAPGGMWGSRFGTPDAMSPWKGGCPRGSGGDSGEPQGGRRGGGGGGRRRWGGPDPGRIWGRRGGTRPAASPRPAAASPGTGRYGDREQLSPHC